MEPQFSEAILLNNMGMNFKNQGKIDKAIEFFENSIALSEDEYVLINLGHAYSLNKNIYKAIDCYKRAIEMNPNLPNAHLNLAHSLLLLKKYKEGFKEYEYRLAVNPHI